MAHNIKIHKRVTDCPSIYTNLGTAENPISTLPFEQITNVSYYLHSSTLTDYLNSMDREFKYNGFSNTANKLTEYTILIALLKAYAYMKGIDTNVSNWNDFVNMFDLSKTVSKLNCDGIDYKRMVSIIDDCFNGIPFIIEGIVKDGAA